MRDSTEDGRLNIAEVPVPVTDWRVVFGSMSFIATRAVVSEGVSKVALFG